MTIPPFCGSPSKNVNMLATNHGNATMSLFSGHFSRGGLTDYLYSTLHCTIICTVRPTCPVQSGPIEALDGRRTVIPSAWSLLYLHSTLRRLGPRYDYDTTRGSGNHDKPRHPTSCRDLDKEPTASAARSQSMRPSVFCLAPPPPSLATVGVPPQRHQLAWHDAFHDVPPRLTGGVTRGTLA